MRFRINFFQFCTFNGNKFLLLLLLFFALKIVNAQTISNTTISNTHFCLGGTYTVTFDTSGTSGSVFTIQLSDVTGSFASPTNLDSSASKSINITIPPSSNLSTNYSLRVVRRAGPAIIGNTLTNLTITKPAPSFTITNNNTCAGSNVSFINTSTGVSPFTCSYSFGATPPAGAPANINNNCTPTVQFNPALGGGIITYATTLLVTDAYGCANSISNNVDVKQKPEASIIIDPFTTPNFTNTTPILFTKCNSSPPFDLTIADISSTVSSNTNYNITWGDLTPNSNSITTFSSLTHSYLSIGSYNLTVSTTNSNNCISSNNYNVYIGSNPSVSMPNPGSTTGQCTPKSYSFNISGFSSNTIGTTYKIESNDKGIDTVFQHPPPSIFVKTYLNNSCSYLTPTYPNSFYLKITASNSCGASTNTVDPIQLSSKPIANFSIFPNNIACVNNPLTFTNTTVAGKYINSLLNTTFPGVCDTTYFKNWSIQPTIGWTLLSGTLTGINASNNFSASFQVAGTYTIRLIVLNNNSPCGIDTIIKTICVQPLPIPNFTLNQNPTNGCINNLVSITNTSNTLGSCGNTQYKWIVYDSVSLTVYNSGSRFVYVSGTDSTSINPIFNFLQKGKYKIRLQVTNTCGPFTKDNFITIKDKPIVTLKNDIVYCDSQAIAFNPTNLNHNPTYDSSYGTINVYNWNITSNPIGGSFIFLSGNSNSKNPVISFSNTSSAPITYRIIVTATNECGISLPDTQFITINPKPIVTATSSPANSAFCSGGSTNIVLSNNLPSGVTYTWRAYASSLNLSGYSNQIIGVTGPIVQTLINKGSTIETVTYKIAGKQGSTICSGDSTTVIITVYPIPKVIATSQTICSGSPTNLVLSSNVLSTLFTWTASTTGTTTGFRDTSIAVTGPIVQTLTNNSNISNDVNYAIKAIANGCISLDTIIKVTVKPIPQLSNALLVQSICSGSNAIFTPTSSVVGTTFNYTASLISGNATGFSNGSGSINQIITNTGNTDALVRYTFTPTGTLPTFCLGQPVNFDVTIKPKPILTVTSASNICSGSQTNIVLNSNVTGTLFRYNATLLSGTNTNGFYSKTTDTLSPIVQVISNIGSTNAVVRYYITPVANACKGDSMLHEVTIFPGVIAGTVGPADTVCSGSTLIKTLTLSGNTGAVVRWEQSVAPFTNWTVINNLNSTQSYSNLTQTTWYRAVIQSGGLCPTVNTSPLIITVDSVTIAGNLTGTDTVCAGTNSGILTLLNKRGSIVNWQLSNALPTWNNIGTTTVNPYSYANLTQTTWYRVSVKNGVCPAAFSDSVRIQVDALPSAANAPNRTACANSISIGINDSLIANTITSGIGLWTYISGPNTPSITSPNATTSLINNMAIGTHLIQWKVSNGKCAANKDTLYFTVYAPLYDSIASNQTICSGQTSSQITTITTSGGNGSYTFQWQSSPNGSSWTNISGATSASYSPGSITATTYYRKVVTSGNCIVPSNSILITVLPVISNTISGNASICFGGTASIIGNNVATGGNGSYSYQWQQSPNGINSWSNITSATLSNYSPGILTSTTFFRRLVNSGPCSSTSGSVTVTVFPLPVVNAGGDSSKCQNQLTYPLNGSPTGGTWSGIGVSSNNFNPSAMALGNYTLVYTFTNANGCVNSDTAIITVIAPPTVNAGNDFSICENAPAIQLTGTTPATGGSWSGTAVTSSGVFNPTAAGAGTFKLFYNFTAGSGCGGLDSLLVTVNPKPTPNFTLPPQICPNNSITLNTTTNSVATVTGYNWTVTNNASVSNTILSSYNTANPLASFPENKTNTDITYNIKLITITNNGCIDSVSNPVLLLKRPFAQFTTGSNINCGPAVYTITNGTSNVTSSYLWSTNPSAFVNINTSTSIAPQITFPVNTSAIALAYNIQLIATRNDGIASCKDTAIVPITVYPKPIISFNASPNDSGCSPLSVNFNNASNPQNSENINTMNFLWNFGIYGTDTARNPQRIFTNTGFLDEITNVKVIGTSKWGCKDSATKIIKVYPNPKADFVSTIYSSCAPFLINNSIVTLTQYPIANDLYTWQILDKLGAVISSSTGINIPLFTINTPNDTVYYRLITSHARGCKPDTLTRMFVTIANPIPSFTMSDTIGCSPLAVNFTNTSTAGVISTWTISNGLIPTNNNSFTDTFINLSNLFNKIDSVKLVVSAGLNGCKDSITKYITTYPKPKAIFNLPNILCADTTKTPTNSSVFKAPSVIYGWKFINLTNNSINDTTLATPTFTFINNQTGIDSNYTIRLRATSVDGCIHDTSRIVTIYKRPLAVFSVPTTYCGPKNDTILNSTALNSTWSWNSTPSLIINNATSKNPIVSFPLNTSNNSINYSIKLTATRAGYSCVDTTSRLVTIYPKPKANFTTITKDSCGPRLVNFTNTSDAKNGESLNTMSFLWTYLSNNISTTNATGYYTNIGVIDSLYYTRLIATSMHGCKDTLTDTVIVRPNAKAVFTDSITTSCAPFKITATNIKAIPYPNANSSYQWFVNNVSLGNNIVFPGYTIVNQNDSVLIKLVAISKNGCKNDTMQVWFRTIANPVPRFIANDSVGCTNLLVKFINTSSPTSGLTYKWDFGDLTSNLDTSTLKDPNFTFYNYGVNDKIDLVKLVITAGGTGCSDSITKPIVIKPLPRPFLNLSDSVLCYPNLLNVNNLSANIPIYDITSFKWKVIGPDAVSILNDTASSNTVINFPDNKTGANKFYQIWLKIRSTYGCIDSVKKTIRIPTRPISSFNFSSDSSCAPVIISTNNTAQYANTFSWTSIKPNVIINNPNMINTSIIFPSHKGTIDSIYPIELISQTIAGCFDTIIKPFKVFPLPISKFTLDKDSGCSPLSVIFYNSTTVKTPASYFWNFGDGNTQINNADTFTKTFIGSVYQDTSYIIQLISTSANGCKDTTYKTIKVKASAFAKIKLNDTLICSNAVNPTKLTILNKSFGSVDTFYWDFGDGSQLITTIDSTIHHPYPIEGTYTIILKATNSCKTSYDTSKITVQTPPTVNFSKSDSIGCSPLAVSFSNLSTNIYKAKFLWNFGNGSTSNLITPPTVNYLQSRTQDTTYYMSLTVSNFCGVYQKNDSIKVLPKPISIFLTSADSGCSPLPVYMINQSVGLPINYKWYFGNGDSSLRFAPLQTPITYRTIDTISYFKIKLIATNTCGIDSMEKIIKVFPNTVKSFFTTSGNAGCEGLMVSFYDNSTGGNSISWNFGDGITSLLKNPTHQYNKPGTFYAYQYVNNGCSFDTSFVIISVLPNPQFTISKSAPNICVKNPVQFNANLKDSGVITWYFGDGDTSNAFNPIHNYNSAGKKIITVMLKSFYNSCISIKYDTINVLPIPVITLTADTNQACAYHLFKLSASSPQTNIFNWDFGDNNTGAGSSISHLYQFGGTYTVKILAQTSFGCIDSTTKQLVVFPVPTSAFSYTPKDTCNGPVTVKFTNLSVGANNFLWNFGNGNNSTNVNPTAIYSNVGSYPIRLISNNQFSCYDTSNSEYFVYQTPKAALDFIPESGCPPLQVTFINKSQYGTSYLWEFGDGATDTSFSPKHEYLISGKYKVKLTAKAGTYCLDSVTANKLVTVFAKPKPVFTWSLKLGLKPYRTVEFKSSTDSIKTYEWYYGTKLIGRGANPTFKFAEGDSGTLNILLKITSIDGCDTSFVQSIELPSYWCGLYVPNAFTPTLGEGGANEFKPIGIEIMQGTYSVRVFSKWGELIWESTDLTEKGEPKFGWDGNDKEGKPCMQGSYIWVVEAKFTNGENWEGMLLNNGKVEKRSNVTLIR